jgi:AcrR family transcriptional regulator
VPRAPVSDPTPERRTAEARREALLDVAQALVKEGGPAAVTMGTVAERAEVTRALVYKHFDNRGDILAALYRREAAALDHQLRRQVVAADEGFEPKLRSFIRAVLGAVGTHAEFFAPLRSFGQDASHRKQQRSWDRKTLEYFTTLASEEFGLDASVAKPAVSVLLSGIVSSLTRTQVDRSTQHRAFLEDLFVEMAIASLERLAASPPPR